METAEVVRVEAWSCGDSESRSLSDLSFSAPDSWPLRRSRPPRLHYADVALGNIAREGRKSHAHRSEEEVAPTWRKSVSKVESGKAAPAVRMMSAAFQFFPPCNSFWPSQCPPDKKGYFKRGGKAARDKRLYAPFSSSRFCSRVSE